MLNGQTVRFESCRWCIPCSVCDLSHDNICKWKHLQLATVLYFYLCESAKKSRYYLLNFLYSYRRSSFNKKVTYYETPLGLMNLQSSKMKREEEEALLSHFKRQRVTGLDTWTSSHGYNKLLKNNQRVVTALLCSFGLWQM